MRVITGRVVHGKIEVDTPLAEGTSVAILAAGETGFRLNLRRVLLGLSQHYLY